MDFNPGLVSPCGLYCGVCAIYYATRDENRKFKERLVHVYKGKIPDSEGLCADDIFCRGCLSGETFGFCASCEIKTCVRSKGFDGCHQCDSFPCRLIDEFPMPVGKKVIMRAIPYWREVGTTQWIRDEENRYICPSCGHVLFRGAKRCNRCKVSVDLD
jgi:hypothetical protein